MSETTGSYSPKDKCEVCSKELVLGQNWNRRFATKGKTICNDCYIEQKQKSVIKDKLANLKDRLVDEPRVNRLVGWIEDLNLDVAKQKCRNDILKNARIEKLDLDEALKRAQMESSKLTYQDIKVKELEHFIMAEILSQHEILDPRDGDMSATWHLAFHYCGYEGYDVDGDGLPLAKPGSARLKRINYVRKKADDLQRIRRLGIVAVRTEEPERRSRKEWRICLCKTHEILDKVKQNRIARQEGEIQREALLEDSMNDTIEATKDAVKQYVDLYHRNRE